MAKRQITGQGEVKSPEPMKSVERQFAEAIQYMLDQMQKRWRSQALGGLQKSTVEKFTDAQTGNFAKVYLAVAGKVRRKLLKQFDDDRLEELAKKFTGKVDRRNREEFYKRVESNIGISRKELEATEGLTYQINAYSLETFQWIKKLRDETLQGWTSQTLRLMAEGKGLPEILSQFDDMVEKRKGHAKMVARTQISTFNSLVSKARAQNLGIEKAIWVTAKDERVRGNPSGKYPNAKPSHHWADGKEFVLSEGLTFPSGKTLLPGVDYACRCTYRMIIPSADEE